MKRTSIYLLILFVVALGILFIPFPTAQAGYDTSKPPPETVSAGSAKCACPEGGECTCPVGGCDCVVSTAGYQAIRRQHMSEGKTLLIWVGYDCPPCREKTTDCLHFRCRHFPTGGGEPGVFVSYNGRGAHLKGPVSVGEIRCVESQLREGKTVVVRNPAPLMVGSPMSYVSCGSGCAGGNCASCSTGFVTYGQPVFSSYGGGSYGTTFGGCASGNCGGACGVMLGGCATGNCGVSYGSPMMSYGGCAGGNCGGYAMPSFGGGYGFAAPSFGGYYGGGFGGGCAGGNCGGGGCPTCR